MSDTRERLNKILNRVEELENTPSELLKDALLADIRELYDAAKALKVESVALATKPKEPKPKLQVSVEPEKPLKGEAKEETPEAEKPVEPEPVVVEPALIVKPVAEKPMPEKAAEEPKTEPIQEKAAVKKPMIGKEDVRADAADHNTLGGQLNRTPLQDLRSGIPLNEKFGMIRTLFKGNASDFGDAVLKLNNAANANEMKHYLRLLEQRFGWDVESEAYQSFYVYIERKMLTLQTSNANSDQ